MTIGKPQDEETAHETSSQEVTFEEPQDNEEANDPSLQEAPTTREISGRVSSSSGLRRSRSWASPERSSSRQSKALEASSEIFNQHVCGALKGCYPNLLVLWTPGHLFSTQDEACDDCILLNHRRDAELCSLLKAADDAPIISRWAAVRVMQGPLLGIILVGISFQVFPLGDVIRNPQDWWRCALACAIPWAWTVALFLVTTTCVILIGKDTLLVRGLLTSALLGSVVVWCTWVALRMFWIGPLNLQYPMPWIGGLAGGAGFLAMSIYQMLVFPSTLQSKQSKAWLLLTYVFYLFTAFAYWFAMPAFIYFPADWQWVVALLFPLIREVSSTLLSWSAAHASPAAGRLTTVLMQHAVGVQHGLFLAVAIGSVATLKTSCVLIALDFLNNLYLGYKVWYLRNDASREDERMDALILVVQSEFLEAILPAAYFASFSLAFLGANAQVTGHVKSEYWHFQPVDDYWASATSLLVVTLVDALSFIVTGLVLWRMCRISVLQVLLYLQQELGLAMAWQQVFTLLLQFCVVNVGCALDYTFVFEWISTEADG